MNIRLDLPPQVVLRNSFLRVSGTAFDDAGSTLDVALEVNGTPERAIWGLPNFDAFDGREASYMSGFTKLVNLGPAPDKRTHEIIATASNGATEQTTRRLFQVRLNPHTRAEGYAAGTHPDFRAFGDAAVRFLADHGLQPGHDVVEIGPGAGRLSVAVARFLSEGSLRAFDVDESAIEFCRKNISPRFPQATFVHQDVANGVYRPAGGETASTGVLPVEGGGCDFAYCWSVFTHLVESDFKTYLTEFARILKPGGKAFLSVLVREPGLRGSFVPLANGFWTTNPDKPEAAIAVELDRLEAMIAEAGFAKPEIHRLHAGDGPLSGQDCVVTERA